MTTDTNQGRGWLRLLLLSILLLSACGTAPAPPQQPMLATATPVPPSTGRGAGGTLRLVYFQAPTLLNPHLAGNVKDLEASRIVYEPLASFDENGDLIPLLAAEIPSRENGGVAADGRSVTWTLRAGVRWGDGQPFTADDVVFTYAYITHPDVPAVFAGIYSNIAEVVALDPTTVQITFTGPTPAWWLPFVGPSGMILPRHRFADYTGPNALDAPANIQAIGTGPYLVNSLQPQEVLFLANDLVRTNRILYNVNPYYRVPDQPYFAHVELRGGGTAGVAARAVLEQGNADFGWNVQLAPDEIDTLEALGKGTVLTSFESRIHFLQLNLTDPNAGSRPDTPHPILSDQRVRQAIAHAINREAITTAVYGRLGLPEEHYLISPANFHSTQTFYPYDLTRAQQLLDNAGWRDTDGDGIRERNGVRLQLSYHVPVNPQYQQVQTTIARALRSIGIDVEIVLRDPNVFFGDPTLRGSWARFQADIAAAGWLSTSPDPQPHMGYWTCAEIPTEANGWSTYNISRYCNPQYDALLAQAAFELDENRRRDLFIQMNDLLIKDVAMIVVAQLARAAAVNNTLEGVRLNPWDADTWNIQEWRRSPTP